MTEVIVIFRENYGLYVDLKTLVDQLERCRENGMIFEEVYLWDRKERHVVEEHFAIKKDYTFEGTLNTDESIFDVARKMSDLLEPMSNAIEHIAFREKNRVPIIKSSKKKN